MKEILNCWKLILNDFENEYVATLPSLTFKDSLTLNLEKLTIKLIYCGESHTNNHIFILLPEENLVFTGDMFSSGVNPAFPINKLIDVPKVLEAIDYVLSRSNENLVVITGHGKNLARNDLRNVQDIIKQRYEKFIDKKSQVKIIEQMINKFGINAGIKKYSEILKSRENNFYLLEEEFTILGNSYIAEGKINEAIGVFEIGLKSFPNSVISLENLATALVINGEIKAAINYFEKSLKVFPDNEPTKNLLLFLLNKY